jgi:hypothetical protein
VTASNMDNATGAEIVQNFTGSTKLSYTLPPGRWNVTVRETSQNVAVSFPATALPQAPLFAVTSTDSDTMTYEIKDFQAQFAATGVGALPNTCLSLNYGNSGQVQHYGVATFCNNSASFLAEKGALQTGNMMNPMSFSKTFTAQGSFVLTATLRNLVSESSVVFPYTIGNDTCHSPVLTITGSSIDVTSVCDSRFSLRRFKFFFLNLLSRCISSGLTTALEQSSFHE